MAIDGLIGSPDASGDGWSQTQKVLRVPGVEGFSLSFEGAIPKESIIDGAAGKKRCALPGFSAP